MEKEIIIKSIDKLFNEHPSGYGFYGYVDLYGTYCVRQGIGRYYLIEYSFVHDLNETE